MVKGNERSRKVRAEHCCGRTVDFSQMVSPTRFVLTDDAGLPPFVRLNSLYQMKQCAQMPRAPDIMRKRTTTNSARPQPTTDQDMLSDLPPELLKLTSARVH